MKYDLRVGGGIGKVIIVASNLTSLVSYILSGDMIYYIAIPCSLVNIAGSFLGASIATKASRKLVKYVSYAVILATSAYAILKIFGVVT